MKIKAKMLPFMETKLERIANYSRENPKSEYHCLMAHFNKENLTRCYHELDGRKAVGTDRENKENYGKNLSENIDNLINKLKSMEYFPGPVRQVLIPKGDGKFRPLGISNFEDKIIQSMFGKILEAIYDPIFHDFSYGFRRGVSCHDAIKSVQNFISAEWVRSVIDVDLKNFFGEINHIKLMAIIRMRIKDERFCRYLVRMLKSGIMTEGGIKETDIGTPQGSVCSPILANIFAHYCIDEWFSKQVIPNLYGKAKIFRYCDDFVICCTHDGDHPRIMKALKGRLDRFSLPMNETKTKVVKFNKAFLKYKGLKQETFDFLGFTFYLNLSKKGIVTVRPKTSKKKFRIKVHEIREWLKKSRHKESMNALWKTLGMKLRGHYNYYGVTFNIEELKNFTRCAIKEFYYWINRRSQRKSIYWESFNLYMKRNPLPAPKIYHSLFSRVINL